MPQLTLLDVKFIECSCRKDEEYVNGAKPLFFQDLSQALTVYEECLRIRQKYFGIHFGRLHIVGGKRKLGL